MIMILGSAALLGGAVLARQNLRSGRVDRKGAFHLAAFIFALTFVRSICLATHIPTPTAEWGLLTRLCGGALFNASVVWLYYIALEPFVRKRWPDRIISWTRLLSGRLRDPMVGRDHLIGLAFGLVMSLVYIVPMIAPAWMGRPPLLPEVHALDLLSGPLVWIAVASGSLTDVVTQSLVLFFTFFFMRVASRRQWAAVLGFFTVCAVILSLIFWQLAGPPALIAALGMAALYTLVLFRFGLVALVAATFTFTLLAAFPMGAILIPGYTLPALFALTMLAFIAVFAARAALAGRSLFELRLLEQ
jgi:hypothetical protein